MSIFSEPQDIKCGTCKKVWCRAPLFAVATGVVPSVCPECQIKMFRMGDSAEGNVVRFVGFNEEDR